MRLRILVVLMFAVLCGGAVVMASDRSEQVHRCNDQFRECLQSVAPGDALGHARCVAEMQACKVK